MAKKAKVRRRYTRVGKAILLIMVLILLAAWNTGTNLYYIVFGGLTSFYLISRLMATGLLRNVHVTIDAPPAFNGISRYRNSEAISTSTGILASRSNQYFAIKAA